MDGSSDVSARQPAPTATPSTEQALRAVRSDPDAVGTLLSYLYRRHLEGTLSEPQWLPVRNAIRLVAQAIPPGFERLG